MKMTENGGIFFECSICTLEYGVAQDRIPRVLNCGHTFCTSCLQRCLRMDSIACPLCKKLTRISFGDMSRVPVNYGILEVLRRRPDIESTEKPLDNLCESCEEKMATIVCISCSPVGVKFCVDCDKQEHNRKFKPVQLHRRMELSQYQPTLVCSRHSAAIATHYSEQLNRFACQECSAEVDWPSRSHQYMPVVEAAEELRIKAGKKHYNLNNVNRMLYTTQLSLEDGLLKLAESASHAKATILEEFKRLADILQLRQQKLILRVEQEYESRKESIELQKTQIQKHSRMISNQYDALRQLLSLPDKDFLKAYNHVMDQVGSLQHDSMLFYPSAPGVIPCFFKTSLDQELNVHGAVGGGPVPENIACNRVPVSNCSLAQLSWTLSDDSAEVNQYEVEYEQIIDDRSTSPNNSGPISSDGEMKLVRVPKSGRAQAHVMNDLYPGFQYRFRVRSRNIAGWGVWSTTVTGFFEDFPVKIAFMGEKVSVRLPHSGQYRITAAGARARDGGNGCKGGLGAKISATFSLQVHDRLEIAVGGMSQRGTQGHTGGGGGTFVLLCNNGRPSIENILLVAGGGGGTRGFDDNDKDGCNANLEPWGMDGVGNEHGIGGCEGMPGNDADTSFFQGPCWGYGGAGFLKSSTTAKSYVDGLEGGQCGGYGGGGGVGMLGGGGGGGFSGGGGGRGGGGGGSYVSPDAQSVMKEVANDSNGYVLIERLFFGLDSQLTNGIDAANCTKVSSGSSSPILSDESRFNSK